jgi:hypothetical protein
MATRKRQQQPQQQLELMANDDNDIRAMPIQFHPNNTFTAVHTNKILRGHFGVVVSTAAATATTTRENEQQLWFQVSLFGSGRSVRGSVYSEGVGLSHNDQRFYVGEILQHGSSSNDHTEERTTLATTTDICEQQARAAQTMGGTSKAKGSSSSDEEQQKEQMQQQQRLFVTGSVTYGSDLGSDARPEPVGTFLLTEVTSFCDRDGGVFGILGAEDDSDDEEDDDDDDDDRQLNDIESTNGTQDNETSDGVFQ